MKKVCDGICSNFDVSRRKISVSGMFLVAPQLQEFVNEFHTIFDFNVLHGKQHHELSGTKSERIFENAAKLEKIFLERNIFGEGGGDDKLYKIFTKKEVPESVVPEIVNRDELGQAMVKNQFGIPYIAHRFERLRQLT